MVNITKQLIDDTPYKYGKGNEKKYITIHETDNWNKGAGAQSHANLQSNGNSRGAAWHYQVDDKDIIQSFSHDFQLWAAGDGKKDKIPSTPLIDNGNLNSIHIEICVNKDSDFKKAVNNAAELTRQIMSEENIPLERVVQHSFWSGKHCPRYLRENKYGIDWDDFKSLVAGKKVSGNNKPVVKEPNKVSSGNSIVDYLKSKGIDSSFNNRSKLAKQYGITGYKGTASQNINLLSKIKNDKSKGSNYNGNSIVDYLKSVGENPGFNNRKKLADKYGIRNYAGTSSQNLELLELMRKNKVKKPKQVNSNYKGNSIVNYLRSIGKNPSYQNRKQLAKDNGINNYTGTASQNLRLLKKLRGF